MQSTEETRALAQGVLDYINANPEKHNQALFFGESECGTTMCIAGTALYLHYGVQDVGYYGKELPWEGAYSEAAGELLGLNRNEIEAIFFDMDNNRAIDKLKKIIVGEDFSAADYAMWD